MTDQIPNEVQLGEEALTDQQPAAQPTAMQYLRQASHKVRGTLEGIRSTGILSMGMRNRGITPRPPFLLSMRYILTESWLNVLLLFVPISWAMHWAFASNHAKDTLIFVFSLLAILPLTKLLAFAADELSIRVGPTLAGLITATLSNLIKLILAITALVRCELGIVQSLLVGSILNNLLLVLGMYLFAGGIKFAEQGFGQTAAQLNSSLLTISVIALLLPAGYHLFVQLPDEKVLNDTLKFSHGVALILLFIYASYLAFQLYSHIFENRIPRITRRYPNPWSTEAATDVNHEEVEEDEEQPLLSVPTALGLLVIVTALIVITGVFLIISIDEMTNSSQISKEFVGLIILPIATNAAEYVTAVTSVKDRLTLGLGVAVGSSIQIALFIIPFIVTLGWIIGRPLTLLFDPYESLALFLVILIVNYVVQDGKSNWLEGMILVCLYLILAVTFWFYPAASNAC